MTTYIHQTDGNAWYCAELTGQDGVPRLAVNAAAVIDHNNMPDRRRRLIDPVMQAINVSGMKGKRRR